MCVSNLLCVIVCISIHICTVYNVYAILFKVPYSTVRAYILAWVVPVGINSQLQIWLDPKKILTKGFSVVYSSI